MDRHVQTVYAETAGPGTTQTRDEESSRSSKVEVEENKVVCKGRGHEQNMPGRPSTETHNCNMVGVKKWVYYAGIDHGVLSSPGGL
jgi:hypothetical protein